MNEFEPRVSLEALDPGSRDPSYWTRFHRSVMKAAGPRLARRVARTPSFEDLLASWSRLFVPGAVAVAALSGIILVTELEQDLSLPMVGVEELLTPEWVEGDPEPLPPSFFLEDDLEAVLFASNPF